jgi:subfamily B ATP-binding cassette protein MsbA
MTESTLHTHTNTGPIFKRMIATYLRPYTGKLLIALAFMAVAAALTAAFALMIEPVIDDVLTAGQLNKVWVLSAAIFGIFFFRGITTYIHTIMMNQIGQSIVADVQRDLFGHFLKS